jgi:extracellular elastinolytic metalloproteinase
MSRSRFVVLAVAVACSIGIGSSGLTAELPGDENRNFDARVRLHPGRAPVVPAGPNESALAALRQAMPDLQVDRDPATGAVRSLYNPGGALSGAHPGEDPLEVAKSFLYAHTDGLGLSAADLVDFEVTDRVPSESSGAVHLYLRQTFAGLPVYNGQIQVHLDRDGRVLSVTNDFLPDLKWSV